MKPVLVGIEVQHRGSRLALEQIIEAVPGYTVQSSAALPCDLLVMEITGENLDEEFDRVRSILAEGQAKTVFLASTLMDPSVLMQALRVGAKEFIPLPVKFEETRKAFAGFIAAAGSEADKASKSAAEKQGMIINVLGSKGGVGTTTLAVNLAIHLASARSKPSVALVDMNRLFGEVPLFLKMDSPLFDWAELARNIARLDETYLMGTLARHRSGVYVLPSPASIFEIDGSAPEVMTRMLQIMKGMLDFVVIDGGQNLDEMSKSVLKVSDKVLLVTLLNLPCLINVKRLRSTFQKLGYPADEMTYIVANRYQKKSAGVSVEDAEKSLKKEILEVIPNDYHNTMSAINQGKTLQEIAAGSEINKKVADLAAKITGMATDLKRRTFLGMLVI
jgi:pilus assembly protein CpaE